MVRVAFVLLVPLALAVFNAGCSRAPAPAKSSFPVASAYSNPVACAACHPAQARTHAQTGMGRAFSRATPATLEREDFTTRNTYYHQASDTHYRMIRRGDRFFLRRHQLGYLGAETNVVEKEIHYVMGSGNHARTYLHRTPDNRLLQLPLGWYAEGGGSWAMNPGYDRADHAGFRREVGFACMSCHNGYPAMAVAGADAQDAPPVYPVLPEGIDCQRCHGPGAAHIEAASQPSRDSAKIKAAILQPRLLDRNRQLEVCMQCHLETTSFSLPHAVLRLGRGVFSYSPAEPLSAYAIHFDHAPGTGHEAKFEIVNAAYRLRQSVCFAKSAMTCTTCHPAHHAPRGAEAARHYSAACRQCHGESKLTAIPAHRGATECVTCHMPKRRTEDVVHAVMTDHLIQRKSAGDLTAARAERIEIDGVNSYRGEVALYYPVALDSEADRDLYGALAQVAQKSNLKPGIARLGAAIAKHSAEGQQFAPHLASALLADGQTDKARALFAKVLEKTPGDAGALRGLADTEAASPERSLEVLRRLLALQPGDPHALYQVARFTRQIADAARAVEAAPESPDALNLLASLHKEAGQSAEAARLFREAIRHQPDLAPLHENLAGLLGAEGQFAEALFHFNRAAQLDPRSAAARFGKAAAQAALGRFADAQADGKAAVDLNPNHAGAWELLGNLAARRASWPEAAAHFQKALAAQPGFARAELGLGTTLAAQRDLIGAKFHLERAAAGADPSVRQEALELLREIAARGGK